MQKLGVGIIYAQLAAFIFVGVCELFLILAIRTLTKEIRATQQNTISTMRSGMALNVFLALAQGAFFRWLGSSAAMSATTDVKDKSDTNDYGKGE